MLTDNILKEMTNRYLPVGPRRVAYAGGDEGAKILDRMGMQYQRLTPKNRWEIGSAQVVILGAGAEKALLESVGKIASGTNSIAVVALPGADLSVFGGGLKIGKKISSARSPPRTTRYSAALQTRIYI